MVMPVDKEKIAELAKKVFSRKVGFNPDSAAARQMSEDTRRNDAVAQKILENSAREEQARNLQDVYTGKRIPSETPLKSDDWKLALALTGLKGLASGVASGFSLPVNNGVARAFNTWGKYAMPSALLDNIGLSSISPIADAAVSSYWTSGLLKNISDASGNGGPSALAAAALLTPGKGDDAIVATIGPKFKAVDALAESARAKSLPTANSGIRILPEGRLPDAKFVPTEGRRQVDKILQDVKLGIEPPLENMMTDVFGDKIYVPDWMAAAMRTEKFKEAYPNGVDIFYRGFSNGVGPRWREALSGYRYGDPTKPAYFGANWDLAKNYAGGHFGPLRIGESLDVSTKGGVPNMYVMMVPKGEIEVVPPFKTVRGWNEWDKLSEPFRIEGLADRQLLSTDDIAELLQTVPKNSEFNKSGVLLQNIHDGALGNEVIWSSRRGGIPKVMHPASTFEWDLGHKWHLKDGGPVNRYDDGGFSIFKRQADNDASRNVAPKIIDRLSAITETAGNYMRALPGIAEKYLTHTGLANAVVDKIFPREETKERQRNDAVAARILQEDAARRKSAEDELLESAYSPSYPGPEAPLKSLDWEIAALLAGLKGPMRAGKTIAKGLETFGKAMMPSTYVGEIMPAAAPYLDAAALSYYSAEAGQQAANEWRKGNYANSVAYGTMAALPAVAPLYNAVREAKPWVDFVVRGKVDPIYKAAARDIDIQRAAARVNQDLGETAGNVGAPRITFKANQRVEPISKEIDAVPLGEQSRDEYKKLWFWEQDVHA